MFSEVTWTVPHASLVLVLVAGIGCGDGREPRASGDRPDTSSFEDAGSTGDGERDAQPLDAEEPQGSTVIRSIAVDGSFACVVFEDGRYDCWWNGVGENPLGWLEVDYGKRFEKLVANGGLCGIELDGDLTCFGYDGPRLDGTFKGVSIGSDGVICALDLDGDPTCVEGYDFGSDVTWLENAEFGSGFFEFEVGRGWACGLRSDGQVECTPTPLEGPTTTRPEDRYAEIAMAGLTSCGILLEGGVGCWGNLFFSTQHEYPRQGIFTGLSYQNSGCVIDQQQLPTCWQVDEPPPEGLRMKSVGAGRALNFACGVTLEDKVVCWGSAAQALSERIPEYLRHSSDL